MKLEVTPKVQQWFKEGTGVQPETDIRLFEEIHGKTPAHDGFSITMSVGAPDEPAIKENLDGITYFIEETDNWFFRDYDLIVDYDEKNGESHYQFRANREGLTK